MVPGGRGRLLALYAEVIPGSLNDKIMCQELNRNQQHVKQALYFLHYFLGKILSSLNSCIHFIYFIFYHHFSKKIFKIVFIFMILHLTTRNMSIHFTTVSMSPLCHLPHNSPTDW